MPAKGDQSRVPELYRGAADVIGEQAELAELLTAVAVPFVALHSGRSGDAR